MKFFQAGQDERSGKCYTSLCFWCFHFCALAGQSGFSSFSGIWDSISHPPQYHVHNHNHIYVISMCVGVGLFVCLSVCLSGRWFTFSNMKKDHSHSEPTYLGQVVFSLHSTVLAQVKPHFPPLTVLLHRCGGDAAFPMQPRRYAFGLLLLVLPSQLVSQTTADTCVSYTACP